MIKLNLLEWFAVLFDMFSRTGSNKLSQVSKKKKRCFLFLCYLLKACNSFLFLYFHLLVRFFPNIRFSNRSDYYMTKVLCSYRHNFCSCEKKAWKKKSGLYGIWILDLCDTRCSSLTNWVNKPTGSRSLNWFVINPWKDDDEVIHIWKSYIMRIAGWRSIMVRYPGGGDVEVLNWRVQTHTCTNVIKIAECIWVNNHVQFLEVY